MDTYLLCLIVPVEEKKVRNDVIVCIPVEELYFVLNICCLYIWSL